MLTSPPLPTQSTASFSWFFLSVPLTFDYYYVFWNGFFTKKSFFLLKKSPFLHTACCCPVTKWSDSRSIKDRPQRWSIFRAMRCRWFIFQQRCDTNYFWEKLNIAIVAIIFLDHQERLFFDYFAHFRTDYFAIIHWLTGIIRKEVILEIRCSVTSWLCTTG